MYVIMYVSCRYRRVYMLSIIQHFTRPVFWFKGIVVLVVRQKLSYYTFEISSTIQSLLFHSVYDKHDDNQ